MAKKRNRGKKGRTTQILEYLAVRMLLVFAQVLPLKAIHLISTFLGNLFYSAVSKRRKIAMTNLEHAYPGEKSEGELEVIARGSCKSFFLTFLEAARFRHIFKGGEAFEKIKRVSADGLEELFLKAKKLHDESKGCIFVTPHIGNWELLPYVSSVVGIPLVVVVRPLDNIYLERLLYKSRSDSGQVIIPKRNALFSLQENLRQGRSIGLLPDQSTMQGIPVDFFGRKATTTPVPAILSVTYKRPIVVVACCRGEDSEVFEGVVSEPIYPGEYKSEKEEIYRLTREMNLTMESVIRRFPDQYLWMHNRWKTYKNKKGLFE